jgi:flagellar protein FliO/FliZ
MAELGFLYYLKFILAFIFVITLMYLIAHLIRKYGLDQKWGHFVPPRDKRRLKLLEVLPIDGRRRLLLCACDEREYVVMLGINGEILLDQKDMKKDQ